MDKTIDYVKVAISLLGGFLSAALGGVDGLLQLYVIMFVFDLCVGALKAVKNKNFASSLLCGGFINKVIALAVIAMLTKLDAVLGFNNTLRNIAIIWFCLCEGASLLENLAILGLPIPDGLRGILVQVKKGFNINLTKVVKQIIDNYNIPIDESEEEKHE
mgnify:FL=1